MKKLILLCAMLSASLWAVAESLPVLMEGKKWVWYEDVPTSPDFEKRYFSQWVEGDTIIGGVRAFKLYTDTGDGCVSVDCRYESDGVVYYYDAEEEKFSPMLDFNVHTGDKIGDDITVVDDKEISVRGIVRRVLSLERWNRQMTWIEGVGATQDDYIPVFDMPPGHVFVLAECYSGEGRLLYSREEDYTSIAGVGEINADAQGGGTVYDLLGRPVAHPMPGNIYILSGKKVKWPR